MTATQRRILPAFLWAERGYVLALVTQIIKYYERGQETAAKPESAPSSQTKVRELFRMAHQLGHTT